MAALSASANATGSATGEIECHHRARDLHRERLKTQGTSRLVIWTLDEGDEARETDRCQQDQTSRTARDSRQARREVDSFQEQEEEEATSRTEAVVVVGHLWKIATCSVGRDPLHHVGMPEKSQERSVNANPNAESASSVARMSVAYQTGLIESEIGTQTASAETSLRHDSRIERRQTHWLAQAHHTNQHKLLQLTQLVSRSSKAMAVMRRHDEPLCKERRRPRERAGEINPRHHRT